MSKKNINKNEVTGFLANPRQFEKLIIDSIKEFNFILNCEQKVFGIFKEISNNKQSHENQYKKLHPVISQPDVLFGLTKVHRKLLKASLLFS